MNPVEQVREYQRFFFRSDGGKAFMDMLQSLEASHISNAQRHNDLSELNKSAGIREVIQHIETVIAQVADQSQA